MSWKEVLTDENHVFSWRKTLTAIAALLFIAACIIYWMFGIELPGEYILIISRVFAFYFLKNRMNGQNSNNKQPAYKPGYVKPPEYPQENDIAANSKNTDEST